ncbi:MAG: hypothetical protein LCH39_01960 [Proteobacteria bacterium]|nr:hypothetical protein [Pseudomonadota bacterium]
MNKTYRHKKTGGSYVELMRGTIEADLSPCVIYCALKDGSIWVRPVQEFDDGRFEPIEAQPAKPAAPQISGDACRHCGNFALVRTGTCQTCQACGETSGCS